MLLAKNCRPEHNIIATGSLRLGSLYEYRSTYEDQIADRHEGRFSFFLDLGEEYELDKRWYNALFGSALYIGKCNKYPTFNPPGYSRVRWDEFTLVKELEHTARVKVKNLSMEREVFNSLIFCMSQVPDKGSANGLFPDYSDRWFVDAEDKDFISNALVRAVSKRIHESRALGIHIIDPKIPLDRLMIGCRHGLVTYLPRLINMKDGNMIALDRFMELCYELEFYKPESYAHELEYRFSIFFVHEDRLVPLSLNSMIIEVPEIQRLVSV